MYIYRGEITEDSMKKILALVGAILATTFMLCTPLTAQADVVTGSITVMAGPDSMALSANGSRLFVANYNANTVSVVDTTSSALITSIPVGTNPWGLVMSPDGSKLYVSNYGGHSISVISTSGLNVTATISAIVFPLGVAISPDGSTLYVSTNDNGNSKVTVIDTSSNTISNVVTLGTGLPAGIVVSPDGSRIYVADVTADVIYEINSSNFVVTSHASPGGPLWLAFSPDGSKLYVTGSTANNYKVFNTPTWSASATVSLPGVNLPNGISLNPAGDRIYVAGQNSNNVSVYKASDNTLIGTIPVSFGPWGLVVTSSNKVFVSQNSATSVAVIMPATLTASSQSVSTQIGSNVNLTVTPTNFTPSTAMTYSVSPSLPAGLTINAATGAISGTPTAAHGSTVYTITGTNGTWTSSTTVTIAVTDPNLANTGAKNSGLAFAGLALILSGLAISFASAGMKRA